jgi:hypothetical protein
VVEDLELAAVRLVALEHLRRLPRARHHPSRRADHIDGDEGAVYGRPMRWLPLLSLGLVVIGACSDGPGARPLEYDLGTCGIVDIVPEDPGIHVTQGSAIEWSTNPPASGSHFPVWAAWDRSYAALDRGFWVHNVEHGAIVFAYRCDAGCPDVVAQLEDVVRAMPADPQCEAPVRNRAIVVADPLLPEDGQVAAVAWGKIYLATCVDPDGLATFVHDYYARAPEDLCADGASLGGTAIAP